MRNVIPSKVYPSSNESIELYHNLQSKRWRLNNLYSIRDKEANLQILKLNHAQQVTVYQYRHNKKIILKSRQQGISTLYVAYYLDDCLFKNGFMAGIQSYGKDESAKLSKRALLMWNELDSNIKEYLNISLTTSNSNGLSFSNGSELKIGNFRGDTLQGLHVSELAKISIKYPEKAQELKTGAFQAVSVNSKISIETTAEGDSGLFVEIWKRAKAKEILIEATKDLPDDHPDKVVLTPLDFQAIFLPWFNDPDCSMDYKATITSKIVNYILELTQELEESVYDDASSYGLGMDILANLNVSDKVLTEALSNQNIFTLQSPVINLTNQQLWWLVTKMEELGDSFDQEYPATPERAFRVSVSGTYFAESLKKIRQGKRIIVVAYNPKYPVYVSYDLGINDEMVLLFAQVYNGSTYIIDEYHNTGQGITHYTDYMKSLPYNYNYGNTIFPHDIKVRDMSSGRSRLSKFQDEGILKYVVLDRIPFMDSIETARNLLDAPNTYISTRCVNLISSLQNYRKKLDKALGVYMSIDVHDIHSNYGASLRYLAQGIPTNVVTNSMETGRKRTRYSSTNTGVAI